MHTYANTLTNTTTTRHWLNKDTSPYYNFDSYDAFHIVKGNRKGGGLVIYIKKKLNGRICETKSVVVDDVLECVTVEFGINQNKTALVSCVNRCSGSNVICFSETIER